jgi:hypothetical protein
MVFVSDKALLVWLFMLSISIGIAVAQFVYADAYGIVLRGSDGLPLKDITQQIANAGTQNRLLQDANTLNATNIGANPVGTASGIIDISVSLVELISGTYVFDILLHLGVPVIFVGGMILLYIALLGRSILGFIRGVF